VGKSGSSRRKGLTLESGPPKKKLSIISLRKGKDSLRWGVEDDGFLQSDTGGKKGHIFQDVKPYLGHRTFYNLLGFRYEFTTLLSFVGMRFWNLRAGWVLMVGRDV